MAFTCILGYGTKIYVTVLFKQKNYRILIIFKYKCSEKVRDAILRLRNTVCAICPENFYKSNSVHPLHGVLEDSKEKKNIYFEGASYFVMSCMRENPIKQYP